MYVLLHFVHLRIRGLYDFGLNWRDIRVLICNILCICIVFTFNAYWFNCFIDIQRECYILRIILFLFHLVVIVLVHSCIFILNHSVGFCITLVCFYMFKKACIYSLRDFIFNVFYYILNMLA